MSASDRSSTIRARSLQFAICNLQFAICLLVVLSCSSVLAAPAAPSASMPDSVIHKAPAWHPPQVAEVKAQALVWLHQNAVGAARNKEAVALISGIGDQATGSELLDRLAEAFAMVDPKVAELVELCSRPRDRFILPAFAWLNDAKTAPLVAANMRLYYGRWLVRGEWFDEALEQLGGLKTSEVVAPAELLFFQAVTYHRMLNKDEGLKVINQLLDGAEASPRRYIAVAYLMQADLEVLADKDSLDHIARRMGHVEGFLDKGRAGPKVRKVEDGIVESLEKLIKKIEDEENKKDSSQSTSNTLKSLKPAQDSMLMRGKGAMQVDKKNIGHASGWGDMLPKEREEAVQRMGRDFPPHYRDAIEQYFRKLATQPAADEDK